MQASLSGRTFVSLLQRESDGVNIRRPRVGTWYCHELAKRFVDRSGIRRPSGADESYPSPSANRLCASFPLRPDWSFGSFPGIVATNKGEVAVEEQAQSRFLHCTSYVS